MKSPVKIREPLRHPLKFVPVSFGTIEIFDDRVAYQGNSIPRYRLLSIIKISIVTTLATTERLPFQVYTRNCLIWYKYYITKAFFVHVTIPPWVTTSSVQGTKANLDDDHKTHINTYIYLECIVNISLKSTATELIIFLELRNMALFTKLKSRKQKRQLVEVSSCPLSPRTHIAKDLPAESEENVSGVLL